MLIFSWDFSDQVLTEACHDVTFPASFDRKKFGCFGDAVVLWFISDRVELSANMRMLNIAEWKCGCLDCFFRFQIRETRHCLS